MVDWLATDPTGSGSTDYLIVGDLNAYAKEDPIAAIEGAGYTNLVAKYVGERAYSYVFRGQSGTLDYALASPSLTARVRGADEYHINADEPVVLDYNTEFNPPSMYRPDGFRTADHDPVLAGICESTPPELTVTLSPTTLSPPNHTVRYGRGDGRGDGQVDADDRARLRDVERARQRRGRRQHDERRRDRRPGHVQAARGTQRQSARAASTRHLPGDRRLRELERRERDRHGSK